MINFFDWPEDKCRKEYPDCFEIIERLVKPEREINKYSKNARAREKWWLFERMRPELYRIILPMKQVFTMALTGKHLSFSLIEPNIVFSHATGVIAKDGYIDFAVLQSNLHDAWAWKYCSSMGISLRYTPSDAFENYPFPDKIIHVEEKLKTIGIKYDENRRQLMLKMQLGLTKTYNQFHNRQLLIINEDLPEKELEKKHGKEILNLWNHLKRTENTCTYNEAVEGIFELRRMHKEMDEAVLQAYGWTDINPAHDFYEVDYLPENDRIRYTISPEARREILKRLLQLNHEIHTREVEESKNLPATQKSGKGKKPKVSKQQTSFI